MRETGQIVSIENGVAKVRFERSEACQKCRACDFGKKDMFLQVPAPEKAQAGDWLQVELEGHNVVLASAIAYGIPLVGLLAGIALGYWLAPDGQSDLYALLGGVVLMGLGFLWIALTEKKRKSKPSYMPRVVNLIPQAEYSPDNL